VYSQLYGLQVDFVNRNGHFMVLSSLEGLRREELSEFQVNMLLANKIPQLLEMQVEELDEKIRLYYNITGKRMLAHWLRLESMTIKQFFTLLYRIVEIVAASNIYMLQEGRYILKEDYIYCGEDWTDMYLTYIPKNILTEKNPVSADLQHLASRLIHKVSELSGSGYQELMNYLMDESFTLPVLKQLLLKHMNQSGSNGINSKSSTDGTAWKPDVPPVIPKKAYSEKKEEPSEWTSQQAAVESSAAAWKETEHQSPMFTSAGAAMAAPLPTLMEDENLPPQDQHRKLKLPVLLIGFLSLGLIWKLYLDHTEEAWLLICSGLSLLIADLIYCVLWIWKPPFQNEDEMDYWKTGRSLEDEEQARYTSDGDSLVPFFTSKQPRPPVMNQLLPDESSPPLESRLESKLESKLAEKPHEAPLAQQSNPYYQNLDQRTTLLAPPDATVLLNQASPRKKAEAAVPYLEWTRNGAVKTVPIGKTAFLIGRPGSQVDLANEEKGTSRIHAEIVREDEVYWIKDLGSRNGTHVNGEVLVPYRMYSLQAGDVVKIINTDYRFKTVV
jgi:hypothetical protein